MTSSYIPLVAYTNNLAGSWKRIYVDEPGCKPFLAEDADTTKAFARYHIACLHKFAMLFKTELRFALPTLSGKRQAEQG